MWLAKLPSSSGHGAALPLTDLMPSMPGYMTQWLGPHDLVYVRSMQALSSTRAAADVEARMQRLEARTNGVYNLQGKLVALDHICAQLNCPIPDLEYSLGGHQQHVQMPALHMPGLAQQPAQNIGVQFGVGQAWPSLMPAATQHTAAGQVAAGTAAGPHNPAAELLARGSAGASPSGSPRTTSPTRLGTGAAAAGAAAGGVQTGSSLFGAALGAGIPSLLSGHAHPASAGPSMAAAAPAVGGTGGANTAKVNQLTSEVLNLRSETDSIKDALARMEGQIASLRSGLSATSSEALGRISATQEAVSALKAQVASDVASLKQAVSRPAEVSFADFTLLKDRVSVVLEQAAKATEGLQQMLGEDGAVPVLKAGLEQLRSAAASLLPSGDGESNARERMDALFHERLGALEGGVKAFKEEVRGSEAIALKAMIDAKHLL